MPSPEHKQPQESRVSSPAALDSYELIGKLARGGMGTVYVARRAAAAGFQRLFAIKLIHEHLADNDEFVQMFRDEACIAARLHHPNVVPIVDTGEVDGRQFVVMDYVEGCSLDQLFRLSPDNRPIGCIVKIFVDFLTGLHSAHELRDDQGNPLHLVHRDVSPQNILVGIDGVTRITDFGIAKAEARVTSTKPGLRKGKLAFMAPEQLYDQEVDRRADIFAAGALLWSSLTGEKLFSGSSDAATMRNLLQMEVSPPSQVGLKPPPLLDELCLKALSRNADDRHQTAGEFARAIREEAIRQGMLGTEAEVSAWLSRIAGHRLQERRAALGNTAPIPGALPSVSLADSGAVTPSNAVTLPVASVSEIRRRPQRGAVFWLALLLVPATIAAAVFTALWTHRQNSSSAELPAPAPRAEPELASTSEEPADRGPGTATIADTENTANETVDRLDEPEPGGQVGPPVPLFRERLEALSREGRGALGVGPRRRRPRRAEQVDPTRPGVLIADRRGGTVELGEPKEETPAEKAEEATSEPVRAETEAVSVERNPYVPTP